MDLLLLLLSNDNGTRRGAELELERLKVAEPSYLVKHLFHSLQQGNANPGAVAMSSVLLRGLAIRERDLFSSLSAGEFAACRGQLLAAFAAESDAGSTHIRRIMGNAMAAIAGLDSHWPELLAHLQQQLSAADTSPRSLQLCLFLMNKLAEHIGPILTANFDQVITLITSCLLEASPFRKSPTDLRTRTAAALALLSFLHEVPPEALASTDALAEKVASCMSAAIAVLGATLQEGGANSDGAGELFAALELLGEKRPQAFAHVWRQLLDLLAAVCNAPADSEHDDAKASALRLATCLLTNSATAELCSHTDTRTAFLNIAMTFVANIEDEGMEFFLRPDDEDGFGDSPSDDSDSSQLPLAGAQCLSDMAACFDSAEIVQTCLAAAWKLVTNQQDWKMRRAALFITANICEGASDAMRAVLPQIVPQILQLATSDPHPRVQYSALHCLTQMVHDFPGDEDDDDEENDEEEDDDDGGDAGGKPSFQDLFITSLPPQICAALQASHAYPRNAACCVHLLRVFFDPNRLRGEHDILTPLMDYGLSIAAASDRPIFVLHEVVVLFGNISQLAPPADLQARYPVIMSVLRAIIGDLAAPCGSREESTLKCLALEAYALVGKAAGKVHFATDAAALLDAFARVLPSMDPSDPLSSYIMQSSGWMAGVLGEDFEPYVPFLLPGLIAGIATEIDIEVSTDDGLANGGGGAKDGNSVYQRGVGNVSIVCNSAQITDKETACRVLTQFMLDVPALVCPYVPDMVRALVPLVDQRFVFSEECAHVIGLCLSEAVSVHLLYSSCPEPNHPGTVAMIDFVLQELAQALRKQHQLGTTARSSLSKHRLCAAIGCMREVLMCLSDAEHRAKWGLQVSTETLSACLLLLRDEMLVWMQAKFAQSRDGSRSSAPDDAEVDEETRANISDALGWVMRTCPEGGAADALMAELWAAQVQPYMDQEPFTTLFLPSLDDE